MDFDGRTILVVGLGAIGGWIAWELFGDGTSLIDQAGDALYDLTTTDETRLAQLGPDAQTAARELLGALASEGIAVKVGTTLRTPAAEKAAIDAGRSAVKTHSWHEIGRGMDLYPIDPDTGRADTDGRNLELFQRMHAVARANGWRGIAFESDGVTRHYIEGKKGPVWDGAHLEWRAPYKSIAEAVAAEGPTYGIA